MICALFQFGAGSLMGGMKSELELIPGILVMIPPLLAIRGNIGGALASRLGTGLHQGIIDPEIMWSDEVRTNISASILLTLLISITTGILASIVTFLTNMVGFSFLILLKMISIAVISGMMSSFGLIGLTVFVALFSYRKGWDPDNVTSPLIASVGDLFTMTSIYIAVLLVV